MRNTNKKLVFYFHDGIKNLPPDITSEGDNNTNTNNPCSDAIETRTVSLITVYCLQYPSVILFQIMVSNHHRHH